MIIHGEVLRCQARGPREHFPLCVTVWVWIKGRKPTWRLQVPTTMMPPGAICLARGVVIEPSSAIMNHRKHKFGLVRGQLQHF